jgi:hypothetical protein
MIVPVLWYVDATSGIADNIVVLEIGAKKLQKESKATIVNFFEFDSLSYTSSGISIHEVHS